MASTTIHELNNPIEVKTPHGDGQAIMVIDYGLTINTVWVVRLNGGGYVKHYYSDDIQIYDNPMNGRGWDVDDSDKGGINALKTDRLNG